MTKKISDMNYEEKYKKAVQQIRDLLERSKENGWKQILAFEKDFEQIFPELAESEDERIRKNCIHFLELQKSHHAATFEIEECIDWLKSLKDRIGCEVNFTTTKERKPSDEHKPADKVESKFKIEKDKWYICIRDLYDNYGTRAFCKGDTYHSTKDGTLMPGNSTVPFEIYYTKDYFRPWTIQDAKDGDLIYVSTEEKGIQAIFHEYKNGIISFHCYLCANFSMGGYMPIGDVKLVYPLQKNHYKTFFAKMREAGCKWDSQSKKMLRNDIGL